jgi:hypothetical protein
MTLNNKQFNQLVENYVSQIVESLDVEALEILVTDLLIREYETYTGEQIIGEVTEQAYTKERNLSTPRVTKSPQIPHKSPQRHINIPKVLDIYCQASYNNSITLRRLTHVGCISSGTEAKV